MNTVNAPKERKPLTLAGFVGSMACFGLIALAIVIGVNLSNQAAERQAHFDQQVNDIVNCDLYGDC